ncbi:MAG: diacylglycerol kinase family protein [Bacillus sp. (in: firmicutes)]
MGLRENKPPYSFWRSLGHALNGVAYSWGERHIKVHYSIALLVVAAGIMFGISKLEWLFIATGIASVIALEMVNTALEDLVDLVTEQYHPLAKRVKDIAAGAVLIASIYAMIVGVAVFGPELTALLSNLF